MSPKYPPLNPRGSPTTGGGALNPITQKTQRQLNKSLSHAFNYGGASKMAALYQKHRSLRVLREWDFTYRVFQHWNTKDLAIYIHPSRLTDEEGEEAAETPFRYIHRKNLVAMTVRPVAAGHARLYYEVREEPEKFVALLSAHGLMNRGPWVDSLREGASNDEEDA